MDRNFETIYFEFDRYIVWQHYIRRGGGDGERENCLTAACFFGRRGGGGLLQHPHITVVWVSGVRTAFVEGLRP